MKKLLPILKQVLFLALGVGLLWFSFVQSDLDWATLWRDASQMNYWFFLISACFAILSHYLRATRWKLLIKSIGYEPKTKNVFASVLFMYASNIALPRSGEVARCGTLYKYEKIPVTKLLGTVVVERAIDLVSLMIFTGLLIFIQFELLQELYLKSSLPDLVSSLWTNKVFLTIIALSILAGISVLYLLRDMIFSFGPMVKVRKLLSDLKASFKQVLKMEGKLSFLIQTIGIWLGYVGMFYICFFAYEPTSGLGFAAGLTVFVAGSFGMVAPTNGGIGAWHFMVIMALTALNITSEHATVWANVAFGIMTVTVAAAGITAFFLLPYMNREKAVAKTN